jgi:hypothetical protein
MKASETPNKMRTNKINQISGFLNIGAGLVDTASTSWRISLILPFLKSTVRSLVDLDRGFNFLPNGDCTLDEFFSCGLIVIWVSLVGWSTSIGPHPLIVWSRIIPRGEGDYRNYKTAN